MTSRGHWKTTDLKAVAADSEHADDSGEAYCLAKTFNSKDLTTKDIDVTLKNATAQVNFIEKTGLLSDNNKLTVTYAAGGTLNVSTGKVTEVVGTITHTFKNIGQLSANEILATDYILAPKDEKRLLDLTIKFNEETEKALTNMALQQCYKTNIKGEYSSLASFTFAIAADDEWVTPA